MSRIFINYRRQDTEGYVGRLYDHLLSTFSPDDIFMDVASIEPGADFVQTLEDAVAACDVFIAMIGPQWLGASDSTGQRRLDQWDDFVRIEIASALKQNKLVIPVLVGRATMPNPADLPDDIAGLARRNAFELSHKDFAREVTRLIGIINNAALASQPATRTQDEATLHRKRAAIKALRDTLIKAEDAPLYALRTQSHVYPVLGDGNPNANMLFIGESPGKYEAERGIPFCGPSGDILDDMLASIQLRRDDIFITNILMDSPQKKREPTPEEITFYTPYLDKLIDVIRPEVIVTLGRFAMSYILKKFAVAERSQTISQLHGKLIRAQTPYGEIHVVPLYHPAVVLYNASKKQMLQKDFEKLRLFV